jgi:hypothetical protein
VARLLLGQRPRLGELPGEHALFWDAVRSLPRRQPNGTGLWRAGCGGTRTSGVRREALCRIPDAVGRDLEERSWVTWLTWTRKREGT